MRSSRHSSLTSPRGSQTGTALVMALVVLVILTLLGVSVMSTVSLEAKMAGNAQETSRALHVAETGLEHFYQDTQKFNLKLGAGTAGNTTLGPLDSNGWPNCKASLGAISPMCLVLPDGYYAQMRITYHTKGNKPKRSLNLDNIYSAVNYGTANFEQESKGTAAADATTVLRQGVSQITPKGEFIES